MDQQDNLDITGPLASYHIMVVPLKITSMKTIQTHNVRCSNKKNSKEKTGGVLTTAAPWEN